MADYNLKAITTDTDGPSADTELLFGSPDQSSGTPKPYSFAGVKIWIKAWITKTDVGLGSLFGGAPPAAIAIANIYACNPAAATTTAAVVANRLYMVPVYISFGSVATMAFTVTSAGTAGTLARVGLYNIKADGAPGTLVSGTDAGTLAVDSTGTKLSTVSASVLPGWYYAAFITDGTPTLYGATDNPALICGVALSGASGGIPPAYIYRAVAFGALGNETSNSFTAGGVGSMRPIIGVK